MMVDIGWTTPKDKYPIKKEERKLLGRNIQKARLFKKHSRNDLATLMRRSISMIRKIEAGTRAPSYNSLCDIVNVLGVTFIKLFDKDFDPAIHHPITLEEAKLLAITN